VTPDTSQEKAALENYLNGSVRDLAVDIPVDVANITISKAKGKRKKRPVVPLREIVRQPDKEGLERYVDPDFQRRLGEVEAEISAINASRRDISGARSETGRPWYENNFYQEMTEFYKAPPRNQMKPYGTSKKSRMNTSVNSNSFLFEIGSPTFAETQKSSAKPGFRASKSLADTDFSLEMSKPGRGF